MSTCMFMLCGVKAVGLVRIVDVLDYSGMAKTVEVAMCATDAHILGSAMHRGERAHITPGKAIYLGDLTSALPKGRR